MWNKKTKAFTLIEVVAAIFIIGLVVGAAFTLLQRTIGFYYIAASQLQATYLAQEGIELVRNQRDINQLTEGASWDSGLARGPEDDLLGKFDRITTTTATTTPDGVDKIIASVNVSWQERGTTHQVTAQTKLYNWR